MNYLKGFLFFIGFGLLVFSGCAKKKQGGNWGNMPVPVVAVDVKSQAVEESLSLVGSLLPNEWVELKPELEGQVSEVLFEEGQKVQPGALLLRLDPSRLQATVAEAEANFKLSQGTLERNKHLFERNLVSQQELDQAESVFQVNQATLQGRKLDLEKSQIKAPFKGVMGLRSVSVGQVVGRGTLLSTIMDLDPIKAEFHVPEKFYPLLKIGQKCLLEVEALPGEKIEGLVYFVATQIDRDLRTILVRAKTANPEGALNAGMFARVTLILSVHENALVVPEEAVVFQGGQSIVFVVDSESIVNPRPVQMGIRRDGWVEALTGLKVGERVITEGVQKVRPGGQVLCSAPAGTPGTPVPASVSPSAISPPSSVSPSSGKG